MFLIFRSSCSYLTWSIAAFFESNYRIKFHGSYLYIAPPKRLSAAIQYTHQMNLNFGLCLIGFSFIVLLVLCVVTVGISEAVDTTWWLSGYKVFPEGSWGAVKVFCPSGAQITGGGFIIDENIIVIVSEPIFENKKDGWKIEAYEPKADGGDNIIQAWAVCL